MTKIYFTIAAFALALAGVAGPANAQFSGSVVIETPFGKAGGMVQMPALPILVPVIKPFGF